MFSKMRLLHYAVLIMCLKCLCADAINVPKDPEVYKKYFGRKLRGAINSQMIAFVEHISPSWTNFIKSVIKDLPPYDEHTRKLNFYLKIRDSVLTNVVERKDKKRKVSLIKAMKKYEKYFDIIKDVNDIDTPAVKQKDFQKLLVKHNLSGIEHEVTEGLVAYMRNIYREWMHLYASIPYEFLRAYPEFKAIDENWKKMINREDFKEKSKWLLKVDAQISKFFGYDNFLKVYL